MPPKAIARSADRTGGVLPVNAAARANASRTNTTKLKLQVRRLPPGLTLTEFEEALGDEWKLDNGKVDWREYRQGKSRAPGSGKVPEQSTCYLHLVSEACVKDFEKRFLEVTFLDKAGTHRNPDLKTFQPTLGFAPHQRTPLQHVKSRLDNRQGTIDQDPEFIAFLEGETQPITKPTALDTAAEKDGEKKDIKTTPLIEDLREKKANKAKAVQAKAEKAEKDKKSQPAKATAKDTAPEKEASSKGVPQQSIEQAARDAAKTLNKQVASKQQQLQTQQSKVTTATAKSKKPPASPKVAAAPPSATPPAAPPSAASPAASRIPPGARQRGNTDGIKKMLQKDLGIKPKAAVNAQPPTAKPSAVPVSNTPPSAVAAVSTPASVAPSPSSTTVAATGASPVKAYLKHANPSQGMTEVLIQQALSTYGEMVSVTIDPRKGTAIAVFKQNEGLKKALAAKRVTVANGAVEVLEYRPLPLGAPATRGAFRGGRGGRGGSRGGAQAAAAPASPAPNSAG